MKLNQIINIDVLQKIQNGFSETFGLPAIIYDLNGKAITKPSQFTEFCKYVRSTEKGNSNCEKFDALLMQEVKNNKIPTYRNGCALKNIITVTIPIIVNSQHLANFGIGQCIEDDFDFDEIKNYAKEINVEEGKLLEVAKTLIPVKNSKLESSTKFLNTISEQISYLATINIQNLELIRKKENTEQKLQIQNEEYASLNKKYVTQNEELIKAKEKAEESDRLKTAFLQNMSHEIRTPLNAISGFSGMLNKPELTEEKRKSFVSIIQNSSNQLISIITDILTISSLETKQEKANINKVCINNIIVDLLSIFKQQAQNQNISIYAKQQLNDKQSEIFTDKTKITQILTNLLTNALKFTHEGFIEFGYSLNENELQFYVKDSGIGIKSEFQEKIFERFRQADKTINKLYGGTGLGLAISKAFVELLNGKIWVKSEFEKGSTFYFTIPYKPVNEIDKTITPTKQNENFRKILVAEDEEFNFLYIEELLIDMDLKLIHAKDGQETVEIFKANPNIDLILMDIKMPIMTGNEAAIGIKEINPNIPIVAQSAYALEHERAKYEGIFDDYLTKPINESVLKQMVMKYIDIKKE